MDIGLFPQFHVEESVARGNGKAMVYMAGGAVAVCENIGENPKLIEDGVNGVLAEGRGEWRAKLERLILDAGARKRIASARRTGKRTGPKLRHREAHYAPRHRSWW